MTLFSKPGHELELKPGTVFELLQLAVAT